MNETKIKILQCLADGKWRTTSDIAQKCGLSLTNVSELSRRYRGLGLVNRQRNYRVPHGYIYRITAVGIKRLHYFKSGVPVDKSYAPVDTGLVGEEKEVFQSNSAITGSSIAENIGLSGKDKEDFQEWVKRKLGGN